MPQRNVKGQTFPVNPIRMFIISVNNIPIVDIVLGLRVSDNKAAQKFSTPYIAAKPLVTTLGSFFFKLRSRIKAGMAKV